MQAYPAALPALPVYAASASAASGGGATGSGGGGGGGTTTAATGTGGTGAGLPDYEVPRVLYVNGGAALALQDYTEPAPRRYPPRDPAGEAAYAEAAMPENSTSPWVDRWVSQPSSPEDAPGASEQPPPPSFVVSDTKLQRRRSLYLGFDGPGEGEVGGEGAAEAQDSAA